MIKSFLGTNHSRCLEELPRVSYINSKFNISGSEYDGEFELVISLIKSKKTDNVFLIKDVPFKKKTSTLDVNEVIDLADKLLPVLNKIYALTKDKKSILIHCSKGISRAPFVYLFCEMKDYYINNGEKNPILVPLIQLLKLKRSCCMPGDLFILVLCYFQYHFIFG